MKDNSDKKRFLVGAECLKFMKKAIIMLLMSVIMVGTVFAQNTHAATKKMNVYETIKKGNIVYCATKGGLYRVNLKNYRVKTLVKNSNEDMVIRCLSIKGKFIYYLHGVWRGTEELYRIKTSGGKKHKIAGSLKKGINVGMYAISGSKVYYNYTKSSDKTYKEYHKVMKKNGKAKKRTKVKARWKWLDSNNQRYIRDSVSSYNSDIEYYYLVTPGRRIYLGSFKYR